MSSFTYAHMCRDGHEQIGHNDSEHEMCPLCRALATVPPAAVAGPEPFSVRYCAGWCLEVTFASDPPDSEATYLVSNFGENERHARQIMDACNRAAAHPTPAPAASPDLLDDVVSEIGAMFVGLCPISASLVEKIRGCLQKLAISPAASYGTPQRGDNPGYRTIQEVLRLHVTSSESMRDTYKRIYGDDSTESAWQEGFTAGLVRAIEVAVADNRAERALAEGQSSSAPTPGIDKLFAQLEDDLRAVNGGEYQTFVTHVVMPRLAKLKVELRQAQRGDEQGERG